MDHELPSALAAVLSSSEPAKAEFDALPDAEKDAVIRRAGDARNEAEMLRLISSFIGRGSF